MLETIANSAAMAASSPTANTAPPKAQLSPFLLLTPRSMLPSWCESPRAPPVEAAREHASGDKTLSIEIPKLDEPESEQRDAAEGNTAEGAETTADTGSVQLAPDDSYVVPTTKYECDYDKDPTTIFLSLQKKEWDAVVKRGESDTLEATLEARTWVSRREKHGHLRWRLLPLHAAIIFKAPENVVETLLAAYPKGAQSKDDQGMLPLHLAFRHGSTEATVNLLLVAFPQSVTVEDRKGRIPLVLAQAAASANREGFVRALERGPTYYANAAAATERAAVTAEQRAIFDAKLIEVGKAHQQDISILKEERNGLNESVALLQSELIKQKAATQVLVDHINSLNGQLKNKGETEKFLAVKAATLDSNLKDMGEAKEQTESALENELIALKNVNARLTNELDALKNVEDRAATPEEVQKLSHKAEKQGKELKMLKMEWASTQARSAVLEAQLKSKIENEHELASQVSQLAAKLANSAADSGSQANMYSKRVQTLEAEREKLRATVNDLGKKLLKVSQFMNKMTAKTQESAKKSSDEAKAKQIELQEKSKVDASNNELLIRTALAERQHMAELLKKQEEEMAKSAKQHQEILDQLEALKTKRAAPTEEQTDEDDLPFTNSLTEEMQDMMRNVLSGMPQGLSDDSDLVDSVMKSVSGPTPKASGSSQSEHFPSERSSTGNSLQAASTDTEEDAQKCLEEALRALEQNRNRTQIEEPQQMKSMSEELSNAMSDDTSLSCNPSDEESRVK